MRVFGSSTQSLLGHNIHKNSDCQSSIALYITKKQMGKQWKQCQTLFWAPKSLQMVIAAMKLKDTFSLEGKL